MIDGKPNKTPYHPKGFIASATNRKHFGDFETVFKAYQTGDFSGVGFVFTHEDDFAGIDLDDCRNPETGEIEDWAIKIVNQLNSYTEVSPSETGLKTFVIGAIPGAIGIKSNRSDGGSVEMYSNLRYFTVTGNHLKESPKEINENQSAITAIYNSLEKNKKEYSDISDEEMVKYEGKKTLENLTEKQFESFSNKVLKSSIAVKGKEDRSSIDFNTVIYGIEIGLSRETIYNAVSEVGKFTEKRRQSDYYFNRTYNAALLRHTRNQTTKFSNNGKHKTNGIPETTDGNDLTFWYYEKGKDKKGEETQKLKIDKLQLVKFIQSHGFFKTKINDEFEFVRVENNVAEIVNTTDIKDFVLTYIRELKGLERLEVESAIVNGARVYFAKDMLECVETKPLNQHKDDLRTSYIYFRNCFIEATAGGYTVKNYSELDGIIWKTDIIDRDFKKVSPDVWSQCNEAKFLKNISNFGSPQERFGSFQTVLGYYLHRYLKVDPKAVILLDESIPKSEIEANGRTGKGILVQFIAAIRNVVKEDALRINERNRFSFQKIRHNTDVFFIDEIPAKFNFDILNSSITDGVEVEQKNRTSYTQQIKLILATNKTIRGEGSTYRGRVYELELAPYYNDRHKPKDDFKIELLSPDYTPEQWNTFYNFMINCLVMYLEKDLLPYDRINTEIRKLIDSTSYHFVEFATDPNDGIIPGDYHKEEFLFKYQTNVQEEREIKLHTFTKYLQAFCKYKGWRLENKKVSIDGRRVMHYSIEPVQLSKNKLGQ